VVLIRSPKTACNVKGTGLCQKINITGYECYLNQWNGQNGQRLCETHDVQFAAKVFKVTIVDIHGKTLITAKKITSFLLNALNFRKCAMKTMLFNQIKTKPDFNRYFLKYIGYRK